MVAQVACAPTGPACYTPQMAVPAGVPGRTAHAVNLASITRRRTELAGPLGDLAKMALCDR